MWLLDGFDAVPEALNMIGGQNVVNRDAVLVVTASFVLSTVSAHTSKLF